MYGFHDSNGDHHGTLVEQEQEQEQEQGKKRVSSPAEMGALEMALHIGITSRHASAVPRGALHAGRSTRAAPWVSLHEGHSSGGSQIFFILT